MTRIWHHQPIIWKEHATWVPTLSRWLRPALMPKGITRLRKLGAQELCWDDPAWLDVASTVLRWSVETVVDELGEALIDATLRVYHGCRVLDAGLYHHHGIRANNPAQLADEVRRIVTEEDDLAWARAHVESWIRGFDSTDRDRGWLYLVVDDHSLVDRAGNYLNYGSEWITVLLPEAARPVLRQRGIPTLISVNLPLSSDREDGRKSFARALLQEWTRIKVNRPDWSAPIDYTIALKRDVPAEWVVAHTHPEVIPDNYYGYIERRGHPVVCHSCR